MLVNELISNDMEPLRCSDAFSKAAELMAEFKVSHIPIVENDRYLGLISEEDLLELSDLECNPKSKNKPCVKPSITADKHCFEAMKLMGTHELTILPVVDQNEQYEGYVSLVDLAHGFSQMGSLTEPGGILILELNVNDYSLTEIARLIESNDAKVLSTYITSHTDSMKLELTLKINRTDLSPIIQTFNRYNYKVLASYHENENEKDLKKRFDSFMNYLNI